LEQLLCGWTKLKRRKGKKKEEAENELQVVLKEEV